MGDKKTPFGKEPLRTLVTSEDIANPKVMPLLTNRTGQTG